MSPEASKMSQESEIRLLHNEDTWVQGRAELKCMVEAITKSHNETKKIETV